MKNVNGGRTATHRFAEPATGPTGTGDRRRARLRIAVGMLVVAAAALLPAATASAGTLSSGTYSGPEGSQKYELYIPSSYRAGTAVPLVVALHGCTQSADQFRLLTRWDVQAEAHGFIVVFPQQDSSANNFTCWNFFQDGSMHRSAGDPARIAAVTSLIENSYNVDPHRVYATGLSAGGAMASVLGATYPDYFAALGIASGCEYAATAACAGYKSADPTVAGRQAYKEMGPRARPMPFIAFQGDADTTVPPANADQLVQQWLLTNDLADDGAANGSVPTKPAKTTASFAQAGRYATVRTYVDSRKAELGAYWLVHGMKHAWSGGNSSQQFSDSSGPDATAAMYAFFGRHPALSLRRPAPPRGMQTSGAPRVPDARKRGTPKVSKPKLSRGRIVFTVSGAGSVTLRLQQRVAGHRSHGRCAAGKGKGRRCTMYTTRRRIVRKVAKAGKVAVALPKKVHGHRLPRGRYRIVVTPAAAGHTGRSRTLALSMRSGRQGTAARWARR
jgi:poly(hydroxyalkanoate) depolymerase family esterase